MRLDVTIQLQRPEWRKRLKAYAKHTRGACEAALAGSKLVGMDCRLTMTVVLGDDAFVRDLNRRFRGIDKPTNVLSFPAYPHLEAEATILFTRTREAFIGDIVLAYETVERESVEQGKQVLHHVQHLLIHGTLHLLGYDHEDEKEADHMEALEVGLLKNLGINNPYL